MQDVLIVVASVSGTAEFLADELEQGLKADGFTPTLIAAKRLSPDQLAKGGLALICSSTTGVGEAPESARPFLARLESERPDLSDLRFGLVALGDSQYPATFCGGGKSFERVLVGLGAKRIGEPCLLDASSGLFPEEVALDWLQEWAPLARET